MAVDLAAEPENASTCRSGDFRTFWLRKVFHCSNRGRGHACPSAGHDCPRWLAGTLSFSTSSRSFGLTASLDAVALELAHGGGDESIFLLSVLGALAVLPLSELAIQIVHAFIVSTFPPSKLPRMDYERGIPAECATLIVVPMMLSSEDTIRSELEKLEVRYLANRDSNLSFGLFSDFLDAPERERPGDTALVECASKGIAKLNERYPGGNFLLFHRTREWSESEGCWIGRERKRGKIEELNAFLTGHGTPGHPSRR